MREGRGDEMEVADGGIGRSVVIVMFSIKDIDYGEVNKRSLIRQSKVT